MLCRRSSMGTRMLGAAVGLLADRAFGEPPNAVHPVAAFGRLMTTLLFGVSPHDAVTLMGVSIAVVLIALLAAVVPAYRATRINPLQALRTE